MEEIQHSHYIIYEFPDTRVFLNKKNYTLMKYLHKMGPDKWVYMSIQYVGNGLPGLILFRALDSHRDGYKEMVMQKMEWDSDRRIVAYENSHGNWWHRDIVSYPNPFAFDAWGINRVYGHIHTLLRDGYSACQDESKKRGIRKMREAMKRHRDNMSVLEKKSILE